MTGQSVQEDMSLPRLNEMNDGYEYCPHCDANLTMQKGYRNDVPYWICKGCGEMLINPELVSEHDIIWRCDGCGALLNIQNGFDEDAASWRCSECGYENRLCPEEIYLSEEEYLTERRNPYRGLNDREVLEIFCYQEEANIGGKDHIILVRDPETGERFVKKLLSEYNRSIYEYLKEHPVAQMPGIRSVCESSNCLIVIEEYVEGKTVAELLEEGPLPEKDAIRIAESVCGILDELHHLPIPIIHRDVKPSNIIVSPDKGVYLLDMNVAKWYEPDQADDTRHMGTEFYAAPEQAGYGLKASSAKADIYAMGMLLNKMLTGHFPKEERAAGALWEVIESCICLEAEKRCTAAELRSGLQALTASVQSKT